MATATSDAKLAELQRSLAASKLTVLRLERELSAARAAAASRPTTPQAPPLPPPREVVVEPPPAAPVVSPGLKAKLAAANERAEYAEAQSRASKQVVEDLRAQVRRLESEVQRRPAPGDDVTRQALQKARSELQKTFGELEQERERRRALQRRLEDLNRSTKSQAPQPFRAPEPPPPARGVTEDEERQMAAKDEETRRMIQQLDGRLGKLEHRKETHETQLHALVASLKSQVASLQKQLRTANAQSALALGSGGAGTKGVGSGGGTSPRLLLHAAAGSPRHMNQPPAKTAPGARSRVAARGSGMARSVESGGGGGEHAAGATMGSSRGGGAHSARDPVHRLQQLDPEAAAALVERKEAMNELRRRLVDAQAERAAEHTRLGYGGTMDEAIHSRVF